MLLLVTVLATLGPLFHLFVTLDTKLVMGNSLIHCNFLGVTFVTLGTAQLHMGFVGEGYLAEGTSFVLVAVSCECGAGEGNQGKHGNNGFFHRYNLLDFVYKV